MDDEQDTGMEFAEFDFNFDLDFEDNPIQKPFKTKNLTDKFINYTNAEKLAQDIDLKRDTRHFGFISGNFIFGDFIEALIVVKNWQVKEMQISTLSMSEDNIYNLYNLINGGYIKKLNLIVSDYFYAHEKHEIVKKIYDTLITDKCDFQLSVARTHAKICIFEVMNVNQGFVVIQTSSNLRSSDNLEQLQVEENKELYDFIYQFQSQIIEKYKTIKQSVGGKNQWDDLINN